MTWKPREFGTPVAIRLTVTWALPPPASSMIAVVTSSVETGPSLVAPSTGP